MNMKKMMVLAASAMMSIVVFAEPSWAVVNTEGAGDGIWSDASGDTSRYSAYLCTVSAAETYFSGNTTYATITSYLESSAANYSSGMSALASGGSILNAYGYDEGEYSFVGYFQPGMLSGDYVAILAYAGVTGESNMFRVFEATAVNDRIVFDPAVGSGAAGTWTAAATIPEPTSVLMLLVGIAGLALKRKSV